MGWQGHEIQYYGFFPCFFNINNTSLKIIIEALSLLPVLSGEDTLKGLGEFIVLIVSNNWYYYNQFRLNRYL